MISLATGRLNHQMTVLQDGRVLVARWVLTITRSPVRDCTPAGSRIWSATGDLATTRYSHTATLLPDGRVLVVGGYNWQRSRQLRGLQSDNRDLEHHRFTE